MAQIIGSLSGVNNVNGALSQSRQLNGGLSAGGNGSGLTDEIRAALLDCFENVAWINDDGQDYYDALYEALYAIQSIRISPNSALITTIGGTTQLTAITVPSGASVTWSSSDSTVATVSSSGLVTSVALGSCTITATAGSKTATCAVTVAQKTLSSISAVYTQSGTVYTTDSLDSLKSDLVVTAHWSDNTTSTVASTDYTLSGTLTAGTSTVTVSYGGKTTTFNVTVTAAPTLSSISAVYTQSGTVYDTDSLDSLKTDLVVTATYSDTSTATVPSTDYTLSGTLMAGTSTVTVSYQSKTTTFTVTVTSSAVATLSQSDLVIGTIQNTYQNSGAEYGGYIQIGSNIRTSMGYPYFDILVDVNQEYEVVFNWNTSYDLYANVVAYYSDVFTRVENHQQIAAANESGWKQLSAVNGKISITPTYTTCIRITFKLASAGTSTFADDVTYINSITVREATA